MDNFYDEIYTKQDFGTSGISYGNLQWKGTDACIDLYCTCGNRCHFDGDFFHFFECPYCNAKYAVGTKIKLIPLNNEQVKYVESETNGFCPCEPDEDTE